MKIKSFLSKLAGLLPLSGNRSQVKCPERQLAWPRRMEHGPDFELSKAAGDLIFGLTGEEAAVGLKMFALDGKGNMKEIFSAKGPVRVFGRQSEFSLDHYELALMFPDPETEVSP